MLATLVNGYLARALERSPRALELCMALDGRRVRMEIDGFPDGLCLTVANGSLEVANVGSSAETAAADVTVHSSPLSLLALAGGDAAAVVARGGASVDGDEQLAQQFQELARLLRPDLETMIAPVTGRIPAHLATRALSLFASWGHAARESVARNAAEYLAHESRDLVPRAEAESFFFGVEALRSELALAEARTVQLSERLAALAAQGAT